MSAVTIADLVADEVNRTITMRVFPGVTTGQIAEALQAQVDAWTKLEEVGQVPPLTPEWVFAMFMNLYSDPSYDLPEDLPGKVLDRLVSEEGDVIGVNIWGAFPSDYEPKTPNEVAVIPDTPKALVKVEHEPPVA